MKVYCSEIKSWCTACVQVMLLIDECCHQLDSHTVFAGKAVMETAALLCLKLLDTALRLQHRFLSALSAAGSSLLLIGLNKLLLGINSRTNKPDHMLHIAKYVLSHLNKLCEHSVVIRWSCWWVCFVYFSVWRLLYGLWHSCKHLESL